MRTFQIDERKRLLYLCLKLRISDSQLLEKIAVKRGESSFIHTARKTDIFQDKNFSRKSVTKLMSMGN